MIVGVILFCGIYAALDVYEFSPNTHTAVYNTFKITELGTATTEGFDRLEIMCKSFPCLILLVLSIKCRLTRIFSDIKIELLDIDNKLNKLDDIEEEFIFGNAYFHYQRSLLCKHIHVPDIYFKFKKGSKILSIKYFRDLGVLS
jgi:hypothetical protein